jgi:hypothetical protein
MKRLAFAVLFGALITSCANTTTELAPTWVDEAYLGKPITNIMVISVTDQEELRLFVESRFVDKFKARGVRAVSTVESFPVPEDRNLEKDVVIKAANVSQSDSVILLRLIAVKREPFVKQLGTGRHINRTEALLRLRTDLYDVKTEKRIWSGQSETWNPVSNVQVIDEVIELVMDDLYKKGLLTK